MLLHQPGRYIVYICSRDWHIEYPLDTELDKHTLLIASQHLYLVHINHIGAVAALYRALVKLLCNALHGVTNHRLFDISVIEVPDADVVVGGLNHYHILALNGESHLVMFVIEYDVALLQYVVVVVYALLEGLELVHLIFDNYIEQTEGVGDK